VKILIVKAAFLPGWINHKSFLSMIRMIGKDEDNVKDIEEEPRSKQ
jgi:hypothetical protein